jgi:hypothetical protein
MGKVPPDPLHKRLEGTNSWSGCSGERKKVFCLLGIEPEIVHVQNNIQ